MIPNIEIKWVGIRKQSGSKGRTWGHFILTNETQVWCPVSRCIKHPYDYVFSGKIGSSLLIEEFDDFQVVRNTKGMMSKNYRHLEPGKALKIIGNALEEEIKIHLTFRKLKYGRN